jgi:hypothetical protein
MKRTLVAGLAALVIGAGVACSGSSTPKPQPPRPSLEVVTATPLGVGSAFGRYDGSVSAVVKINGQPKLAIAYCDSKHRYVCPEAQALFDAKIREGKEVTLSGKGNQQEFVFCKLEADGLTLDLGYCSNYK